MSLILARKKEEGGGKPGGCLEIALAPDIHRTGDLWHISVQVDLQVQHCANKFASLGHLTQ